MLCDIIIPIFNQAQFSRKCIESIRKNTYVKYHIIIVDDKSNEPDTVEFIDRIKNTPDIKVIHNNVNLGWVKSVNRGFKESTAEYVCVMNNDTIVTSGWLGEMISIAEKEKDIGLVNPEWEKPQRISIKKYSLWLKRFKGMYVETDWVRGFCFLVKREVLNKIGGLDEVYAPGYYDDCDFSVRAIKAGFRCVRARAAFVYHHRDTTHKSILGESDWDSLMRRNKQIFYQRWGKPLRVVFALNDEANKETADNEQLEKYIFSLLREQHHIYIWKAKRGILNVLHTNVRISLYPQFLFNLFAIFNIWNNLGRNINKRYDAIFINNRRLFNLLSILKFNRKIKAFLIDFNNHSVFEEIKNRIANIKDEKEIVSGNINKK
jgi:GT2 family glycosyltransferase